MPRPASAWPTDLQAETWALVKQLGSQSAAARHLGVHQGVVRSRVVSYAQKTGASLSELPHAQRKSIVPARPPSSMAAAVAQLLRRQDELEAYLGTIDAKLDQLLARPVSVAAFQATNRRQADGGRGGRRERKLLRAG